MAAPETEFRPAGLTVPQLTPSVYHATPVNVPSQAGELWAQVGKNLMTGSQQVIENLMNYASPAARAKMRYATAGLNAGTDIINQAQQAGYAPYITRMTPEGPVMMAPGEVSDPTMAARLAEFLKQPGTQPPASGPPPKIAPRTETDQTPLTPSTPQKPPTTQESGTQPPKPTTQVSPSNLFAGNGGAQAPAAPGGFQGPNQAQTNLAVQQALARNQFASSGQGIPAGYQPPQGAQGQGAAPPGYFLNPSTGSYEPLQQGPPPAPGPPTPLRPAPVPPAQQPLAQALNPQAQQTQPNWAQGPGAAIVGATPSLHPVMSSQTALDWAKGFDTSANRAVYLPQGPSGEPAYAFYGPKNKALGPPIPISQMVRHGATGLVGGENLSSTLNVADQQQAAQQAAQQGQPPQPQPPPGAPAPPGPLLTSTAYNPAPYQQGALQANPQYLSAGANQTAPPPQRPGPNGQPLDQNNNPVIQPTGPNSPVLAPANISQADQNAAQASYSGLSKEQLAKAPRDPVSGNRRVSPDNSVYNWYVDDDPKSPSRGRLYTTLPGTAGSYWDEQRFYLGSHGYQLYELPDSSMRQNMQYWVDQGALTRQKVSGMSAEEMKPWLAQKWRNENLVKGDPDAGLDRTLNLFQEYHKSLQQVMDIQATLLKHNVTPNWWTHTGATLGQAGESLGIPPVDQNSMDALNDYDKAINQARSTAHDLGAALQNQSGTSGLTTPKIPIFMRGGGFEIPSIGISPQDVLDQAWSGRTPRTIARNLDAAQEYGDQMYKQFIGNGQAQWRNIDPRHQANMLKIDQHQRLDDPRNVYANQDYPGAEPPKLPRLTTQQEVETWKKNYPGKPFEGWNKKTQRYEPMTIE